MKAIIVLFAGMTSVFSCSLFAQNNRDFRQEFTRFQQQSQHTLTHFRDSINT
ncbi:hypothetical protein M2480_000959 [Parabacteroides sp. PFB2-12]|nr:hypothetical protein [Parabacteroides sp. PM6-13]MDH6389993.1 hypothetical protein [Parabacteroides sp. PFB2-12]